MLATWGCSTFPKPTLSLDFAGATSLDSGITFTRATTATYFNSLGVLTTAASGAARFDYNPSTLAPLGLLIEEARTNLLTYSAQFDDLIWAKLNVTVTANAGTAPDGTASADLILPDATLGQHRVRQDSSLTSGTTYSNSIYFKAAGYDWIYIQLSTGFDGAGSLYRNVNIANGTLGSGTLGANDVTVTPINNGWYRVNITRAATSTTTGRINWLVQNADAATASFSGDGVSGVLAWGAQLETGAFPTSYIPTTTTALTRNADVASMTGTNFSSWYNATEGTLYAEAIGVNNVAGATRRYAELSDGTANERMFIGFPATNQTRFLVTDGGVTQADVNVATGVQVNLVTKMAAAYKVNNFQQASNGTLGPPDTSGTLPTVDRMFIGQDPTPIAAAILNGTIRRIAYYPTRLPDATLQALTA